MYVILHAVFNRQKNELARYQNLKLGHQNGIIMFISNLLLDASDIEALQTILRCNRDLSYARIYPHPHTTCSSKVQVHVTLAMLCFIRQTISIQTALTLLSLKLTAFYFSEFSDWKQTH